MDEFPPERNPTDSPDDSSDAFDLNAGFETRPTPPLPPANAAPRSDEPSSGEAPTPPRARGRARERQQRRRAKDPDLTKRVVESLDQEPEADTPRPEREARRPRLTRSEGRKPAANIDWIPQAARARSQQVKPSGGFQIPGVPQKYLRPVIYIGGGLLLVIAIIIALNMFKNEEVQALPPNAIWIGTEWTYQNRSEDEIQAYAARLKEAGIGTVYAWVSWLKEDGTWAGTTANSNQFIDVQTDVQRFVTQFKNAYPEADLYGWIGFPVELGPNNYRLDDTTLHRTMATFSKSVVEDLGFDGVFLNVEQVWNDNADDFVAMLMTVRQELGANVPVAVAIPPDWSPLNADIPKPPLIRPGTEWDTAFKQRVALLTDQMAIMAYNSGLDDPNDYADWVAYQVEVYARAIAELDAGAALLIGIPTYDNELPGHNVIAENVPTAITGVRRGLSNLGSAAINVQGIAIYAGWTTDDDEWEQYLTLWGNRN